MGDSFSPNTAALRVFPGALLLMRSYADATGWIQQRQIPKAAFVPSSADTVTLGGTEDAMVAGLSSFSTDGSGREDATAGR